MLLSTQNIDKSQVKYRRRTLYFSADGRHAQLILSCHVARRSNYYFVKNLTVALSVSLRQASRYRPSNLVNQTLGYCCRALLDPA